MDLTRLNELIKNPDAVSTEDANLLNEILIEYPYFQAARLLLAHATKDSENIKTAAVYTAYRSVLKKVINHEFDPEVNLPNLNNLDLSQDDFNALEHLSEEDSSTTVFEEEHSLPDEEPMPPLEDVEAESSVSTSEYIEIEDEWTFEPAAPEESHAENSYDDLQEAKTSDHTEEEDFPTFQEVQFDEPAYLADSSDYEEPTSSFDTNDEDADELPIADPFADDPEIPMSADYQELMASLEALRKTRERNQEEEEENAARQKWQEMMQAEESKVQTEEPKNEHVDPEPPEEVRFPTAEKETPTSSPPATPEANTLGNESIPKTERFRASEHAFAIDAFLEEYEAEQQKKTKEETDTFLAPESSFFALDDLLNLTDDDTTNTTTKSEQQAIIDAFIEQQPQIKMPTSAESLKEYTPQEDLARHSVEHSSMAVSENLAQILTRQGKFGKAIDIYEALILKYPEKKAYFAARIEFLKNKQ